MIRTGVGKRQRRDRGLGVPFSLAAGKALARFFFENAQPRRASPAQTGALLLGKKLGSLALAAA